MELVVALAEAEEVELEVDVRCEVVEEVAPTGLKGREATGCGTPCAPASSPVRDSLRSNDVVGEEGVEVPEVVVGEVEDARGTEA